jgi:tight adherence protein C
MDADLREYVIYGSVGLSVALVTWMLADLYGRFDFSRYAASEDKDFEEAPFWVRALLPYGYAAGRLALDILGEDRDMVKKYREKVSHLILMAGEPAGITATDFTGLTLVVSVLGLVSGIVIYSMVQSWAGPILVTTWFLGLCLPYVWISDRTKDRQKQIRRGLPYCLDLMTLAVEAGMDFTTAMQIVSEKLKVPALAMELRRTLRAIQMGKVRSEALRDLAMRAPIPDVSSVTAAIIQADELGANLGPILRVQSEQIRTRRFQLAEKMAMEAPVKMLLPLIAFLFPTSLIVIFGPIAAGYLDYLFRR